MPITFPPLVVTGQVISAAYANSQRAAMIASNGEIHTWTQTTNAAGFGIIGLGNVGCDTVAATGTIAAGGYSTGGLMVAGTGVCSGSFTSPVISAGTITASGQITAGVAQVTGPLYLGGNVRYYGATIRYVENESQHMAQYVKSGGPGYAFFWRKSDDGHASGPNELDLMQLNNVGALNLPLSTAKLFVGGYGVGTISLADVNPTLVFRNTTAGVNEKHWDWACGATSIQLRAVNDGYSVATSAINITRSGHVVTGVEFSSGVSSPLILNAEVPGTLEGGQIQMRDGTGSGQLFIDNYQAGLRIFRQDVGQLLAVSGVTGRLRISLINGGITYENQAQAVAAGLVAGEVYWTSTGALMKV